MSYLGTYAADRQKALTELFLRPAAMLPEERFVIGGAQYPAEFPWSENIFFTQHLEPAQHPAVLLLLARDTERDPARDGGVRLLSFGAAV